MMITLPISDCHVFGWTVSIIAAACSCMLALLIARKYYRVKRTAAMRCLTLIAFALTLAVGSDPIVFALTRSLPSQADADRIIQIQSSLAFALTAVANIFLVLLVKDIFYENKYKLWMLVLVFMEIAVAILEPALTIAGSEPIEMLLVHMIASFVLYFMLAVRSFKLRARLLQSETRDVVGVNGFTFIGLSGILLIVTVISFIMQEIAFAFEDVFRQLGLIDSLGCSLFVVLGFAMAVISVVVLYIGYYVPARVRNRWESGSLTGP